MTATDNFSGSLHHIQLSGLEAGTTYYYQVNCNGAVTGTFHFSTFPAAGKFTFIVYGDTQDELPNFSQAERHKLIADQIAREENILFVVNTGDLINDGNDNGNWDRYFDATRAMGAGTAVFPVHGNHDGDTIFYDIFGLKPYYSFDCANAHFTVLDTIDSSPDQTNWLKTDLANDKDWKFVSFHYPLYTSDPKHFGGWENFKKEWENIFINNQVDAIWNGHIHAYERYLENGIMYIVAGTGGGPYGLLNTNKYAGYQNSLERSLGYAKVTINPAAGTALVEIIRVADISLDGKEVTQLPQRTIYETFRLTSPTAVLPAAFTNGVKTTINAGDLPHRTLLNGARHSDDNLMDLTGVLFRMLADQFNVDSNFFKILFHPK
jgi:predicted phosphodiesterase